VVAEIDSAYVSGYLESSSFISVPFPDPEKPDTTIKIPFLLIILSPIIGSFNILDLFTDLLDLCLQTDRVVGHFQVVRLGKDGICFPVHLLSDKVQLASDSLFFFQCVPHMLDMALQPDHFLVRADLIRE